MFNIELLEKRHNKQNFDCGIKPLNDYIQCYASQHSKKLLSKTHVITETDNPDCVIGYYSLSNLSISQNDLPIPLKGYPQGLDLPAVLIGRLAVDKKFQGNGVARHLLAHALVTIKKQCESTGIVFVVVDAKFEDVVPFYEKCGFERVSKQSLRMLLPVKSLFK